QEVIHLTGESEISAYIAASTGGTHAPHRDLVIGMEEDDQPLAAYNWSQFDADERLYAKLLPKDKYEILDYRITIPAEQRTVRTLFNIRHQDLTSDTSNFVGLRDYNITYRYPKTKKTKLLYQLQIINDYTSQPDNTRYNMKVSITGSEKAANKQI